VPVWIWVTVMVAEGMTPPDESETVPKRVTEPCAGKLGRIARIMDSMTVVRIRMGSPFHHEDTKTRRNAKDTVAAVKRKWGRPQDVPI
jgi:hypothetical protein